ncbi:aldehyde dehydrogenase family protein [Streptomyces sp. SID5464]|nr:aldehyde dehydrogenase family protein [Streptomyces sp. SID5464]
MENPRTGETLGEVVLLPERKISTVAWTAEDAFRVWRGVPVGERCARVLEMAGLLEQQAPRLAREFSREHGKTAAEAEAELARSVETLRWSAHAAVRVTGATPLSERAGAERTVEVDPVGPVLAIVSWNFPAVVLARKLGPALAMGCSVVIKAPEETPQVIAAFARAAADAGLPPGTVQVVHASAEVTQKLVGRPEFRLVSFTGSTKVGKAIAHTAAATLTQCVLELGGHAPVIVTADADLDRAVALLSQAKFSSAGQSCAAPSRFLIDRSVHDEFVEKFVRAAPLCDDERSAHGGSGTMGPLNNARRRDSVHALVQDAVEQGARIRTGGRLPDTPGYYYPATVLTDVPPQARILREEPFGPVAPVVAFDSAEEAVAMANATDFALSAYVFGETSRATALARRLDAGSVSVNCVGGAAPDAPLGGRAASGYGYEGGDEGLLAFGRLKVLQRATPTR